MPNPTVLELGLAGPEKNLVSHKSREFNLAQKYGLTPQDYSELFDTQKARCAICQELPKRHILQVDHDHETGRVRGLLCGSCNKMLGHAKDSPARLLRALNYLARPVSTANAQSTRDSKERTPPES